MKVKNLNPIERHVEKGVLVAAVLAAAYLVMTGMEPTHIESAPTLGPGDIEGEITKAITKVKEGAYLTESQITKTGQLSVLVPNYTADYKSKANAPLPDPLTHSHFRYLPLNADAKAGPAQTQPGRQFAIELPFPDPINVHAVVGRGKVRVTIPDAAAPDAAPAATPPAAPGKEQDATVVRISGNYPLQELRDRIGNIHDPDRRHRLAPELQFVAVYRLEVQRQERNADGTWPTDEATWKPVTALKNIKAPDEIPFKRLQREQLKDVVAALHASAATILTPPMYDTEDQTFFPPLTEPAATSTTTAPAVTPRRGPGGGPRPPVPAPSPVSPEMGMGPAGEGPGGPRSLSETLPAVWAYDENVVPEHEYRYRMRAVVVNPIYQYELPRDLKQPTLVGTALIESSWVLSPESVTIKPTSFFYVVNNGAMGQGKDTVDIRIFKFFMGKWYHAWQKDVRAGTFLGDVVQPTAENKDVDFSTGYTVVDVMPDGSDATVVLLNGSGQLVTRSIREDKQGAEQLQSDIAAEIKRNEALRGSATQPKPTPPIAPPPRIPGMPAPQPNRPSPHPTGMPRE